MLLVLLIHHYNVKQAYVSTSGKLLSLKALDLLMTLHFKH